MDYILYVNDKVYGIGDKEYIQELMLDFVEFTKQKEYDFGIEIVEDLYKYKLIRVNNR